MKQFRADLHCHTTCSDGTVRPQEIIQMALDSDLQGLSITDHDTIEAYLEAFPLASSKGLPLVSGVELSTMHKEKSVHILAYSFSLSSPQIRSFCEKHRERRILRNQQILHLLATHGMPISEEDLPINETHSVGRPHIAQAMVKKGYVKSIQQAFHEYIGESKPCYVSGKAYSVEETIDIIHQAKGLAIIAHPHLIEETWILKDLLEMNFDGIEGYYARFPRNQIERWIKIGDHKGWIITGGSDFHGSIKPHLPLGSSWISEETFFLLQNHFQQNQKGFSS